MTVTVRFAPSPTGHIHIGNARTALFNWLFALKQRRPLHLRFDDTDVARSQQEYADAILYDLHWLGVHPDATEYQSRRFDDYDAAVERLKAAGVLYPCYETPEELELRRKVLLSRAAAAGLRPRGAEADAASGAEYEADGPQAALALPAAQFRRRPVAPRAHRDPLERPGARRRDRRPRLAVRSGAGARGRQLSLHAAVGGRRHRARHHRTSSAATTMSPTPACRSRCSRRSAPSRRFRPPQSADHGLGRGAVEAQRRAVDRQPARSRHRADGGGVARGADRHLGKRRRRSLDGRARRALRSWRRPRNRRRSSIRPSSPCSTGRCCTTCRSPRRRTGWRRSASPATGPKRSGWRFAAISTRSPTPQRWWRIVTAGPAGRPELSDEDRDFVRDAYDFLPTRAWDRGDLEGLDRPRQGSERPQGQGALHAAAAGAYWTFFWAGACRSIAAAGSGRNTGPTTLTLRWPGGGSTVGGVLSVGSPAGEGDDAAGRRAGSGIDGIAASRRLRRLAVTMLPASCPCARAAGAASDNAAATSPAASGRAALPI